ncbi:arginine--tRNA ligase [Eubacterium brachy ATCC 33089]|nr:arginine--tRNA ligase [Eubacterium brachy ATCC 33089]
MKNYRSLIGEIISNEIGEIENLDVASLIEVPTDEKMGDYAFPCFRLAKEFRKAPDAIAAEIAEKLQKNPMFESVENVNAYVNIKIKRTDFIKDVIEDAVLKGDSFTKSNEGEGKKVLVDYSSPNIAKPFHIGHIRSTVIGNALYLIYKNLGYDVVRINHLGDYGTQFGKMIVAYRKWGNKEDVQREPIKTLLSYYTKFHEEAGKNPELDEEARRVFVKLENGEAEEVALWKWFKEESLKEFEKVYKMLNIQFDSYAGESFYSDKIPAAVAQLEEKGLLKESQNSIIVDLDQFGLAPALVKKSDGSTLYITRDIAAALYRKDTYDFYKCLYVVASQQDLHFKQLFKVMELMGNQWAQNCIHVQFGMVSLAEGTLSTRKGRVVFLEDVLNKAVEKTREVVVEKGVVSENIDRVAEEVGIGAVVFNELAHNRIKDYTFDWDKVLNFEGETGPYVQYTHARSCSLLRKAGKDMVSKAKNLDNIDYEKLTSDTMYELAKLIHNMPEVIKEAADRYEPSVVTRHVVKIAQGFNRFYNEERILQGDATGTVSRLTLVIATKNAIKNGLALLGIKAPERM